MRPVPIIIWSLLFPLFALGQSIKDTVKIGEVRVYARRPVEETGLKITRPDSMAMVNFVSSSFSELLSQNTPVFIKDYGRGSMATASFRGTAASHTQLLWNGINLNSPMRGMADLSQIPVLFADNTWLLHGGSSLTEGTGALGGSVLLSNSAQWNTMHNMFMLFERGSFGAGTYMAKIQLGAGGFRSVTRFMYDHSDNDFPYYNVGVLPYRNDTVRNADFNKKSLLQEFYYRFNPESQIAARFWYHQNYRNLPQLMSYEGSPRNEYQDDDQLRAMVEVKNYARRINYHFISGLNHTEMRYFRNTPEFNFVNDDSESRETSQTNRLKLSENINPRLFYTVTLNGNYIRVKVSNPVRDIGYDKSRFEAGFLFNLQYKPSENWGVFVLIRSELYDKQIIPVIPALGADVSISDKYNVLLKANLAYNYHKPSLNDLYWIPGGNPELKPEKGPTGDISIVHTSNEKGRFKQELSLFYSKINDWIIWQPASNGAWYWEAANVREVLSRGIEYNMSGKADWNKTRIDWSGNYGYTRSTNENAIASVDKSRGKQLIYIPLHTGNLHTAVTWNSWILKGSLNYTGRRYTQSSNEWSHFESVLNPFWLTGAAVERKFETGNWSITARLKADNLLNSNYQQILWRPMPGRHYTLTLALRWN